MSRTFPEQVHLGLVRLCALFSSCLQRYALQCSDDGRFAQLIFAADLARAYRSRSKDEIPPAICELLCKHLVAFEEQCGTFVKTLAFFLRDVFSDRKFKEMQQTERRMFLIDLYHELRIFDSYPFERIEVLDIKVLTDLILNTFPREVFDRKGIYRDLLVRFIENNIDRLDDYLKYHQQLSFVTLGPSIDDSCLIDGILIPIANAEKLLPSFRSKTSLTMIFLDLSSSDSSTFTIRDENQQFFSYDSTIYRQFIEKYLVNVDLILSRTLVESSLLFEFHRAEINVIDTLDEETFELLLQVYQCLPCNRLILFDDETIDQRTTQLLDGYVRVDQQIYIYLSSNGRHQTLLTAVPTSTLILTTEKILINLVRLVQYLRDQLKTSASLPIATESEYLRFIDQTLPSWKNLLMPRRIHLDRHSSSEDRLPICLFREYLLNGINFLGYIHKIDGVYSTKKRLK